MGGKSFTEKSNARRAARALGLDLATLIFNQDTDGRWTWTAPAAEAPERVPVCPPDGGAAWRALYEQPSTPVEPVEDAEPEAAVPARGKAAALVAAVQRPEGITNTEIRALTGWTKLGGFFGATKRAGLTLRREREGGDTRWHVARAEG